ncbi:M16 family metallopeptidase [candidate division CSSED10-310 bacterium]|uniref:M16 family metallopeptidase n=1 Tax=candidate division CSSED10-310 bacterium TaxID=2855610 RepID=A0ABV6YVD1_UNCC1
MKDDENYQKTVLSNKICIVTEKLTHVRSVTIGILINTGSRDEDETVNGISHFIEHMIFKGTKKRSARQIAADLDSIGGFFEAFTSREYVCLAIKVLDANLTKAVNILADILLNPKFDEPDIERERAVILEEIKMVQDSPDELIHDLLTNFIWQGNSLGRPISGSEKNVRSFQRPDLVDFFRNHLRANNMVIATAGNFEHEKIVSIFERHFGDTKISKSPENVPIPEFHAGIHVRPKELEQVHFCLAFKGLRQAHSLRYISYVYNTLLGGSMSSRLFQKIREQHGLVYSIFSYRTSYRDAGFFSIYAACNSSNVQKVIDLSLKNLDDLATKKVSKSELERVKSQLKGSLVLGLESTYNRMNALAKQEIYFQRYISLNETLQEVDKVTPAEVNEFGQSILSGSEPALVVIGPVNDKDFILPH